MMPRIGSQLPALFFSRTAAAGAAGGPLRRPPRPPGPLALRSCGIHVDSPPNVPTLTTSYAHGTSSRSLRHSTIAETLLQSVERWPDREALVFLQEGVRKNFAEFQQDVDQTAAGLLALGLQRGDRLGMWGPNIYEWLLFQFATAKAGIILVSVNPAYQVNEVAFALQKVQCHTVVCPTTYKTQKYVEMLRQICPEIDSSTPGDIKSARLPDLRAVIVTDSRNAGMFHMDDVRQAASSQHMKQLQDLQKKLSFDDPVNIQFTSGTTGTPKGATLSHHNIINNVYFFGTRMGYSWRPQTRICLPVPMYHCFGSVGGGMCMAVHGSTVVCTFLYGTPTMYVDMLAHLATTKFDLSSVEAGIMAGSPCPPEVVRAVISEMGIKEITLGYGTTENSPVTFCGHPLDNEYRKAETVGYIIDHIEAKIVNPVTGEIVPLGTSGEMMVRGHCVMLGYWNDEEKTRECITPDGWYKTGDIASMDSYSYCRIEGRIKDMIIRGGENIYPAEIEQNVSLHLRGWQVVGVKDPLMGEEVCACIKLREGQECTQEEIRAFCKGQISHHKIPRYVTFVDSYPLTVSGKIQKNKLSEQVEKLLGL
ncbi:hypothetical protein CRUP_023290 [Coryphaenoides rupestris]|nr:hypothetical protein CRUP_023290 [Coryphaenoides rupestris]